MKGWRTIGVNALTGLGVLLAGDDLAKLVDPQVLLIASAVINILLRLVTTTPVGEPAKVIAPALVLVSLLGLAACSKDNIQANVSKVRAVAVKVKADLKQVEVKGCAGAEVLFASYDAVKDLIPDGSDKDEVGKYVAVAEPVIEQLCTKVQMERR